MNLIACAILYGNAAMALQPPRFHGKRWALPTPLAVRDAFLLTGMFNSYSLRNADFFISGLRTATGETADRRRWVTLRLRDHFAQRHGVTFTQFFLVHHWDALGARAQRLAWADVARRIRERHNRLHPERPVARVLLGSEEWPQHPASYRAGKHGRAVSKRTWFVERNVR